MSDEMACAGCHQVLHHEDGGWLDEAGSAYCEKRYDRCPACQDGEAHPHWINGLDWKDWTTE